MKKAQRTPAYQAIDDKLTEIYRTMSTLKTEDLTKLKRRLDELTSKVESLLSISGVGSSQTAAATAEDLWMLNAIKEVLEAQGISAMSVSQMQKSTAMSAFREKRPLVAKFLRKAYPKRDGQYKIFRLGLELLCKNLREMNVPVAETTLLRHIHRIPAVIDRELPGYAQAGLLKLFVEPSRPGRTLDFDPLATVGP